jgi:serine/threonine protein phosphatase PrpC
MISTCPPTRRRVPCLLPPPALQAHFDEAYAEAFRVCNERMHEQEDFDDTGSGTTAITAFLRGAELTIANIGDSRAILGQRKGKRVVPVSLSMDHTPYRQDERERVRACGAEIMSYGQFEGTVPYHENWSTDLGNEIDSEGDPPRVWIPGGDSTCAFTRSIGDHDAEAVGVTAEPEMLHK